VQSEPATRHPIDRRLSVAPMMDWTDRHCRYFLRLIAPRTLLYTEMIPTGAILLGQPERFLPCSSAAPTPTSSPGAPRPAPRAATTRST
jgi:tRNA-dihydrouridine synthase A